MGVFTESTQEIGDRQNLSDNRTDRDHQTGKMIEEMTME